MSGKTETEPEEQTNLDLATLAGGTVWWHINVTSFSLNMDLFTAAP